MLHMRGKNDWMNEQSRFRPKRLVSSTAFVLWAAFMWLSVMMMMMMLRLMMWSGWIHYLLHNSSVAETQRGQEETADWTLHSPRVSISVHFNIQTFSHICTILRPLARQHVCDLPSNRNAVYKYADPWIRNVYSAAFLCLKSFQTQYIWVLSCNETFEDIWQRAFWLFFSQFLKLELMC